MFSLFSYLITILGVMFWFFRAIICFMISNNTEVAFTTYNLTMEIILLFVTVPCFVLIFKRNLIGATVYFGAYGAYFGTAIYELLSSTQGITGVTDTAGVVDMTNLLVYAFGIVIPLLTFIDILVNKNRNRFNGDKKTDWYYKDEKYEREYDERADRNQYRT